MKNEFNYNNLFISFNLVFYGKKYNFFFAKSHSVDNANDIFVYLLSRLFPHGKFEFDYKGILQPSIKFWKEFYSQLKPEILEKALKSYAYKNEGKIALPLISGEDIVTRISNITRPMKYEDNLEWTIKGRFGPYELPDTIVHASSHKEVDKDIKILRKYNLI